MPVLKVHDGTDWRKVGCPTAPNGRLKLYDGSAWWVQRCGSGLTVVDAFTTASADLDGDSVPGAVGKTWAKSQPGVGSYTHAWPTSSGAVNPVQTAGAGGRMFHLNYDPSATYDQQVRAKVVRLPDNNNVEIGIHARGSLSRGDDLLDQIGVAVLSTGGVSWRVIYNASFVTVASTGSTVTAGDTIGIIVDSDGAGTTSTVRFLKNGTVTASLVGVSTRAASTRVGMQAQMHALTYNPGALDDFAFSNDITTGRPLKAWDGTAWVTVACMVPA